MQLHIYRPHKDSHFLPGPPPDGTPSRPSRTRAAAERLYATISANYVGGKPNLNDFSSDSTR